MKTLKPGVWYLLKNCLSLFLRFDLVYSFRFLFLSGHDMM